MVNGFFSVLNAFSLATNHSSNDGMETMVFSIAWPTIGPNEFTMVFALTIIWPDSVKRWNDNVPSLGFIVNTSRGISDCSSARFQHWAFANSDSSSLDAKTNVHHIFDSLRSDFGSWPFLDLFRPCRHGFLEKSFMLLWCCSNAYFAPTSCHVIHLDSFNT